MDKQQKKIFDEIRKMEIETFKDVEKTANKINAERRKEISPDIFTKYPEEHKNEYFTNDLNIKTGVKKHVKNGSITECA